MTGNTALKTIEETSPQEADPDPRAIREKAGLTRAEMAELLGMSEFGYSAWEAGTRRPGGPAFQLLRLIEADPQMVRATLKA